MPHQKMIEKLLETHTLLHHYKNGNADIYLFDDGTRATLFDGDLKLDYPLNIDIRLSNRCGLGYDEVNKRESKSCAFCHESATKYGKVANLLKLQSLIDEQIPHGVAMELAIGINDGVLNDDCKTDTFDLMSFFEWAKNRHLIVNATINQFSLTNPNSETVIKLKHMMNNQLVHGVGVSFRDIKTIHKVDKEILLNKNTVVHVIAGIDNLNEVYQLANMGVQKILILGEKEFGFNTETFNTQERIHNRKVWLHKLPLLLSGRFKVVSFDNLALEQLKVNRFLSKEKWNLFNQGEHSFYINAVDEYFAPSSRSYNKVYYGLDHVNKTVNHQVINIQDFFKNVVEQEDVNKVHHKIIPIKK